MRRAEGSITWDGSWTLRLLDQVQHPHSISPCPRAETVPFQASPGSSSPVPSRSSRTGGRPDRCACAASPRSAPCPSVADRLHAHRCLFPESRRSPPRPRSRHARAGPWRLRALIGLGVLLPANPKEASPRSSANARAQASARSRGSPSRARSLFTAQRSFGRVAANSRIDRTCAAPGATPGSMEVFAAIVLRLRAAAKRGVRRRFGKRPDRGLQ